jgi:hypothetical protein
MNWTMQSLNGPGTIRIDASGKATSAECQRMVDEVLLYPEWHAGGNLLIDCRKVNVRDMTYDEADRSAMILKSRIGEFGNCKMALIATPGLGFGIGQQFKRLTESKADISIEVFLNESAASRWLGIQTDA